jgi:hypothetical protein
LLLDSSFENALAFFANQSVLLNLVHSHNSTAVSSRRSFLDSLRHAFVNLGVGSKQWLLADRTGTTLSEESQHALLTKETPAGLVHAWPDCYFLADDTDKVLGVRLIALALHYYL